MHKLFRCKGFDPVSEMLTSEIQTCMIKLLFLNYKGTVQCCNILSNEHSHTVCPNYHNHLKKNVESNQIAGICVNINLC